MKPAAAAINPSETSTKMPWKKILLLLLLAGLVYILYTKTRGLPFLHKTKIYNDPKEIDLDTTESKDLDNSDITYTQIHPFLLSTPKTVMQTTPPKFLTDVKNPCFAMDNNFINVGNINLTYALKMKYEIRCLPYTYVAGEF